MEKVEYRGWPNCYRLSNGTTEAIVTTDVGPRVIRYGFVGGQNLFYECMDQLGNSGEPWWMIRGGHRLWVAPETVPDTYALDNSPLRITEVSEDSITLLQPIEKETGLQKEMTVSMNENGTVRVLHRIENCGSKVVKMAPWAATLLAPGGLAFASFPARGAHHNHLQPTHPLVLWAYTDLSDKRWTFTNRYVCLRQDRSLSSCQKIGLFNENTFAAYLLDGELFTKRSAAFPGVAYPDFNSSFEVFTNPDFMELETLGPLVDLVPGASVSHVEDWSLHRGISIAALTDEELDRVLGPFMK